MVTIAGALKVWFQCIHQSMHLMASAYQIFDKELCIANIRTMNWKQMHTKVKKQHNLKVIQISNHLPFSTSTNKYLSKYSYLTLTVCPHITSYTIHLQYFHILCIKYHLCSSVIKTKPECSWSGRTMDTTHKDHQPLNLCRTGVLRAMFTQPVLSSMT